MLSAMPIYEFRCPSCEEHFEELVRGSDQPVACPSCGGTAVERLLSVFAGVGGSREPAAPDYARLGANRSAGCGPGCGCHH
jgi:putative FmdB family regulatory protein